MSRDTARRSSRERTRTDLAVTLAGNLIRVRKKSPTNREAPAAAKIQPKVASERPPRSVMWPANITTSSVHPPKSRLRRPKYRPLMRSGTTSAIAVDHVTLPMLFASVATSSRPPKARSCPELSHGRKDTKPHGRALKMKLRHMIW